ncbi:MAG: hypothetical protein ACI4TK_18820 [Agathobacter sp.]
MSTTQELRLAREQATDIKAITYWWITIKEMEYIGALCINGTYRYYYKTKGGQYYYKEIKQEENRR